MIRTRPVHAAIQTPSASTGRRRLCLWLVVILVGSVVALPMLGSASLPDPAWIPGVYDAADYDDIALAVTFAESVLDGAALPVVRLLIVVTLLALATTSVPRGAATPRQARSPPTV